MVFSLNVATDLYGKKHNTSMEFAAVPNLSELIFAVEGTFDREARLQQPDGAAFRVQTMQVYDDVLQRWADLHSAAQLHAGSQVFVFQPASLVHSEANAVIPAATITPDTYLGSPSRARIAADLGINAALSEKIRRIYAELEGPSHAVPIANLQGFFGRYSIEWTGNVVGDLAARQTDLLFDEWARWAVGHPALIDSVYYASYGAVSMSQPMFTVPADVPPTGSEMDNIAARRAREEELRRSYALGWTAEREQIDRQYRAQRKADLDLQIRHLKTKNQLDRIRATERADADAVSLSRAMIANAASPPRRRDDLCRMYYSPASPKFGYLSP